MKLFEIKVSYDTQTETHKEAYMVDALSYTEAEARIISEVTPFAAGGIEVDSIRKTRISEIINLEEEWPENRFFKATVNFITLDNDKIKAVPCHYLVKQEDIQGAMRDLEKNLESISITEYEIASITATPILELFEYAPPAESKE